MSKLYIPLFTIAVLMIFYPIDGYSQVVMRNHFINTQICEEFVESKEIYLLINELDTMEYTSSNGDVFTFETLVRENWPDKKLIKMNSEEYRKQKDVKNKFYITLLSKNFGDRDNTVRFIEGINIQKGRTGNWARNSNRVYWVHVNLSEIREGVLAERLVFATQSLRDILYSYDKKNFRGVYTYKSGDYKDYLNTDTLYLRKSSLKEELRDSDAVEQLYSSNFKIVSNFEWEEAIKERREHVLFLEIIRNDNFTSIDVYSAKEGKIIISSYPWTGMFYHLDEIFFEKTF